MSFLPGSCRYGGVRRPFIQIALLLSMWALPAIAASAQETVNYASVSGRVTDPQGAVVAGAEVTARQTETNVVGGAITDTEGRFRFPYLRVGPYEITVRQPGSRTRRGA